MSQVLGVAVAAYATWAIGRGEVYARDGWWGRNVHRDERPTSFWSAVVSYLALSVVLIFVL